MIDSNRWSWQQVSTLHNLGGTLSLLNLVSSWYIDLDDEQVEEGCRCGRCIDSERILYIQVTDIDGVLQYDETHSV